MRPKKYKELIPTTAEKTGVDEETVRLVVDGYWDKIREACSNLSHFKIHVLGLGNLYINKPALSRLIETYETDPSELIPFPNSLSRAEKLKMLKKVQQLYDQENNRRYQIRTQKTYEQPDQNLEEPKPDH